MELLFPNAISYNDMKKIRGVVIDYALALRLCAALDRESEEETEKDEYMALMQEIKDAAYKIMGGEDAWHPRDIVWQENCHTEDYDAKDLIGPVRREIKWRRKNVQKTWNPQWVQWGLKMAGEMPKRVWKNQVVVNKIETTEKTVLQLRTLRKGGAPMVQEEFSDITL